MDKQTPQRAVSESLDSLETPPRREPRVSKAPPPIRTVNGSGYRWRPEPQPIKTVSDFWRGLPALEVVTQGVLAEAARKHPTRDQLQGFCQCVVSNLTPHIAEAVNQRTLTPPEAIQAMRDLLHLILRDNSDNRDLWMLGPAAHGYEYPLEKTVKQSAEWLVLLKAVAEISQPATRCATVPPARNWPEIKVTFMNDHTVRVSVRTQTCNHEYPALGFADNRSGKPNSAWAALLELAKSGGSLQQPNPGKGRSSTEKAIQALRKQLKILWKIDSDPIPLSGAIYQAAFGIDCSTTFTSEEERD